MVNSWLDEIPIWLMFAGTVGVTLMALEVGYRLGLRRNSSPDHEKDGPVAATVAAVMTLLGLLLAFIFSFAANRFEERRKVLIDESNNIGTCYLRTSMLPAPHGAACRKLLREYVDARLEGARDVAALDAAVDRSLQLQNELWTHATAVAKADDKSIQIGLFVQSLNAVIDSHSERLTASLRTRLPGVVWTVLYALTVFSFCGVGYQLGLVQSARSPALAAAAIAFAMTLWLVVDLERPHQGALRINQQPMIDLRASMTEPSS